MEHIEGNFKGVRNTNIYYQAWLPEGEVKAVLLVVHGLGEHSGRYRYVVDHFVPLGYAIYALDHIGHGKSEGEREVIERFSDFIATLKIFDAMVRGWQAGKPIFLYGHSMGGLITCTYLLDYQAGFQGAVISAPAIKVSDSISPLIILMGKVFSTIAPKLGVLALDIRGISRDPQEVDTYAHDPLIFKGKTPARLAAEMLKAMQRVTAELEKIRLPLIIIQGGADKLVDPGGAQLLYDEASSPDKTLKIYPALYHEVHNEPERLLVFKDIETWLEAHI